MSIRAVACIALLCVMTRALFAAKPDPAAGDFYRSYTADSMRIVSPRPGAVISGNSLLIEVEPDVPADTVKQVEFRANYYTAGIAESDSLGSFQATRCTIRVDTSPPFRTIWDISNIQDHAHGRMVIVALALTGRNVVVGRGTSDFVIDRNPRVAVQKSVRARYGKPASPAIVESHPVEVFRCSDNEVRFQSWWDWDSLYFVFEVSDDNVITRRRHEPDMDSAFWLEDGLELFVDPHNRKKMLLEGKCKQTVFSAAGQGYGGTMGSFGQPRYGARVDARIDSGGYVLSCAIAWGDFGVVPKRGSVLGMDIASTDRDAPNGLIALSTWAGLHLGNHHNPSEWGHLELTGGPFPRRVVAIAMAILLLASLAVVLWRRPRQTAKPAPTGSEPDDRPDELSIDTENAGPCTRAVLAVLRQDYTQEECTLQHVADKVGRNPTYVSGTFKKETGIGLTEYLNRMRMTRARELLETTAKPASEISLEVGYANYTYFVRVFKKHFGVPPSRIRQEES